MQKTVQTDQADYVALLSAIKGGDHASFAKLLHHITPIMFKYFYRMGANQMDAEDLTQDVALKLWHMVDRYDATKSKFTSWLYTVCYHTWCDAYRSIKRRYKQQQDLIETLDSNANDTGDNTHKDKTLEDRNRVRKALNILTEKQRNILILTYYHGMTYQECAENMKMTSKAIERQLSKTRKIMKDFLLKEEK